MLLAAPVTAQDEIVITGGGLDTARGEAAYGGVTIGRDRLANAPSNRLEDVLRDVPGFQQFRRSDARSANPTSQGATFRALGGNASSRALVILDGVPQTDPFGGWIAWPAFDPRRLGQIRVTRGGGGANGPGALAGTIELGSAGPDEATDPVASLAYGSRNGVDAFTGYGARLGGGFAHVSASYARGDGFIPVVAEQRGAADRTAPYEQASLALRAAFPVHEDVELQANMSAFADARERGTAFSAIENKGADASLRLVGRGALPFSLLGYVQLRQFANDFAAVGAGRAAANQTLDQYNVPATGLGARAELRPRFGPVGLRLGTDWRATEGETRELFQFVASAPTRGRVAGGNTRTLGAYGEVEWDSDALLLTAGGRIDHWRIAGGRLAERSLADGTALTDTAFPDRESWEPTARAGAIWRLGPSFALRAAAYRGWRLPTLNELYRPFRVGADATAANAALAPERLNGVEAGLELRPAAGARIAVTAFANRLEDAISNVTLGTGPGTFPGVGFVAAGGAFRQRRNVDAIVSRGVELDASLVLGRWQLAAGYSFADATVRASGTAAALDGLRPAQAPRHSASASLAWAGPRGERASLALRYAGSQYEDDLNRQLIPGALTFDAFALLPLTQRLAFETRAENLTDARVVAGISGTGIVERASPRTLWLGLRWTG
ncbi:MAG: TonB-dependent receptor [Sphingomonas sp.]|nr:TonB-dependent receptor [Sphingomonas sp.]